VTRLLHAAVLIMVFSRHIVQDLTKDNVSLQSQNRLLEAESKMLQSELEELREVR
jgi:hypothetical protein